jgi:hypothetical protein
VAPAADARVESAHKSSNYGSSSTLAADNSPATSSYLRFDVQGVGPVAKATLRLFVTNPSSDGPAVYPTDPSWSERSVTWKNRPPRIGPVLDNAGGVSNGRWVDYDVSPAVPGDGSWSFELAGDSGDGATFSSREASSDRPQLVLVPAPDPPPPPPPPPPDPPVDPIPDPPQDPPAEPPTA